MPNILQRNQPENTKRKFQIEWDEMGERIEGVCKENRMMMKKQKRRRECNGNKRIMNSHQFMKGFLGGAETDGIKEK